jgi:hypothetical protein
MEEFLDLLSAVTWLKRRGAGDACVRAQGIRWRIRIGQDGTAHIQMIEIDPLHSEWVERSEPRR